MHASLWDFSVYRKFPNQKTPKKQKKNPKKQKQNKKNFPCSKRHEKQAFHKFHSAGIWIDLQ